MGEVKTDLEVIHLIHMIKGTGKQAKDLHMWL